jgi:hypothetical protein
LAANLRKNRVLFPVQKYSQLTRADERTQNHRDLFSPAFRDTVDL